MNPFAGVFENYLRPGSTLPGSQQPKRDTSLLLGEQQQSDTYDHPMPSGTRQQQQQRQQFEDVWHAHGGGASPADPWATFG